VKSVKLLLTNFKITGLYSPAPIEVLFHLSVY